jgi:hypothetical protein
MLAMTLALVLSASVVEAGGHRTVKRVKFQKGRTTAILKGTLHRGDEMIYVLGASEGQTLTAHITTSSPNHDVVFTVTGPGGTNLDEDLTTDWSQTLPASGDYRISVGMIESKKANYTLEVTIR